MTTTGTLSELGVTGDHRVMWDRTASDEVAVARQAFDDLKKKGYLAYRAQGKKGDQGDLMRTFDPDAERIIMVKPLQGG